MLITLNWSLLTLRHNVQPCVHGWVSDASIADALAHLRFDDPAVPHHRRTNRAQRIASIVAMMDAGVTFDPVRIGARRTGVVLKDGHHRLRAYQFRWALSAIPAEVDHARWIHPGCVAGNSGA